MKRDIEIIRGTTNKFSILVHNAYGEPYNLAGGDKIYFGVKKNRANAEYVILKECTSMKEGVCEFTLSPDDTINLDFGRYLYDVGLETGNDYYNIIEASTLLINTNITRAGDGA